MNRPTDPADETEWAQKNTRRIELIRKKNRVGLTPQESSEFLSLQDESLARVNELFPSPDLERVEEIAERLDVTVEM